MNQTLLNNRFKSLLALGLINGEQYQQATTHERLVGLTTESDGEALFHLVVCGVVNEQELEALADQLRTAQEPNPGEQEKLAIVDEALSFMDVAIRSVNREPLDALLALDLINTEQHEAGLDIRPTRAEGLLDSPARALAILVSRGIVAEERLAEITAQGLENSQQANAKERLAVATEAAKVYHGIVGKYAKAMAGGALRVFGLMMLAIFGVIGLAVWLTAAPSSVPECGSSQITTTVNSMLFTTHIQLRSDVMRGGQSLPAGAPRLKEVREVGYAKADRVRGCAGTLDYGDAPRPYAFTVRPGSGEKDKESRGSFVVTGADLRMIEARFSHIDAQGNYAQQAEPIGRLKLENALRAGVEAFNRNVGNSARDRLLQGALGRRQKRQLDSADPDRQREIAEVEPLAPCRAVAAPTRYACRLLVERNDPLLQALGRAGSQWLEAEFTFERDSGASEWRMSEEFPREFSEAIAQARLLSLKAGKLRE